MGTERKIVSVLLECGGPKFRVIDNLRELIGGGGSEIISRTVSEAKIGRKVLDLAREVEAGERDGN